MKIKIAHVAGGLTTGGVEAVLYNYFSHMNKDDYELYYISYDKPNEEVQKRFEELGFHVYEVCKKKEHFFKSCMQVVKILKDNEIQIIHSHMTLVCFITSFLAKLCGVKVTIAHSHLAQHITGIKKYIYGVFKWLTKLTSDYYIACGDEAAIYLYGKKDFLDKKVMLMHNAIDIKRFSFQPEIRKELRRELNIEDSLCIGHVGRFTEQKNHLFLIDIMKEIVTLNENAVLLLLGEGPLEPEVKEKVKALSLEKNVRFLGSSSEVYKYYQAMDVFLLPSLYEGLAVSLVEAQCSGVSVITADTVTEEIHLAEAYEVLSLSDSPKKWAEAVCAYADKKETVSEKRKEAAKMIQKAGYDIEKEAEKLDAFYKKLVQRI